MRVLRSWLGLLGTLALAGLPAPAGAQPVGSEFQVNTYSTGFQSTLRGRAVVADGSGNFVVAWCGDGEGDSLDGGVFGQRYDGEATPLGAEFLVNSYTTSIQFCGSVAAAAGGEFVVVWTSYSQDGSHTGVFGQRYDGAGEANGAEFQVNTFTTHNQFSPDVVSDVNGNFVVVWVSAAAHDGSVTGIFGQRYDGAGAPQGSEFRINSYTASRQSNPAVASDADGNFVVVWQSAADGSGYGVFGQRYDGAGNPRGAEFRVNSHTTSDQDGPVVAADASGNFVVVWTSNGQDGGFDGIFGQRFDSAGVAQGGEFRVNSYTTSSQTDSSAACDAGGNFVVVWRSAGQDGSSYGIFGQRYDSRGVAQGEEFQVNSDTLLSQRYPSVAATGADQFVVVWEGNQNVFGQRFDFSGGSSTIHVGDLDRKAKNVGTSWQAQVKTLVHDSNHVAESGVLVTFNVSGGLGMRTCTTVASGVCEVSATVGDAVPSLTFSVTNLSKVGIGYDAGANHDPDPDSNGTVIVVNQP